MLVVLAPDPHQAQRELTQQKIPNESNTSNVLSARKWINSPINRFIGHINQASASSSYTTKPMGSWTKSIAPIDINNIVNVIVSDSIPKQSWTWIPCAHKSILKRTAKSKRKTNIINKTPINYGNLTKWWRCKFVLKKIHICLCYNI